MPTTIRREPLCSQPHCYFWFWLSPSMDHYLVQMFTDIGVISALGAAVLAGACWMLAIARLDVGFAYPFMALSFVLVPIGSKLLFGETLPVVQIFALALIIAGVTLSALTR
jgi:drug/metabolite transporter (DMT)-like permease